MKLNVYYRGTKLGYIDTTEFGKSYNDTVLIHRDTNHYALGGWSTSSGWNMYFFPLEIHKTGYGKNTKYELMATTYYRSNSDAYLLYIAQDNPNPKYLNKWYEPKAIIQENYGSAINRLSEIETYAQGHEGIKYGYFFCETRELYEKIKKNYMSQFPKNENVDDELAWSKYIDVEVTKYNI